MTDHIRFIRPTGAFRRVMSAAAGFLAAAAITGEVFCPLPALANGSADGIVTEGYREPSAGVIRLLTAPPPPEVILHWGVEHPRMDRAHERKRYLPSGSVVQALAVLGITWGSPAAARCMAGSAGRYFVG